MNFELLCKTQVSVEISKGRRLSPTSGAGRISGRWGSATQCVELLGAEEARGGVRGGAPGGAQGWRGEGTSEARSDDTV